MFSNFVGEVWNWQNQVSIINKKSNNVENYFYSDVFLVILLLDEGRVNVVCRKEIYTRWVAFWSALDTAPFETIIILSLTKKYQLQGNLGPN